MRHTREKVLSLLLAMLLLFNLFPATALALEADPVLVGTEEGGNEADVFTEAEAAVDAQASEASETPDSIEAPEATEPPEAAEAPETAEAEETAEDPEAAQTPEPADQPDGEPKPERIALNAVLNEGTEDEITVSVLDAPVGATLRVSAAEESYEALLPEEVQPVLALDIDVAAELTEAVTVTVTAACLAELSEEAVLYHIENYVAGEVDFTRDGDSIRFSSQSFSPFIIAEPAAEEIEEPAPEEIEEPAPEEIEEPAPEETEEPAAEEIEEPAPEETADEEAALSPFARRAMRLLGASVELDRLEIVEGSQKIYLNGGELVPGETEVHQGDEMALAFQWTIANNFDVNDEKYAGKDYITFVAPFELANVKLHEAEEQPLYDTDGEQIGTFSVNQENGILIVNIPKSALEGGKSNIGGAALLTGQVDYDPELSRPDGTEIPFGFSDGTLTVIYRNEGSMTFKKTASKQKDGTILYTLTVTAQDIATSVTVSDTLDEENGLLALQEDSFVIKRGDEDITESVEVTLDGDSFSLTLPDVDSKKEAVIYTVTYQAALRGTLADGSEAEYFTVDQGKTAGKKLTNSATLSYTDENGEPAELTDAATTTLTPPSLTKSGEMLKNGSGTNAVPLRSESGYQGTKLYYYPVLYTLSINPGDLTSLFTAEDADTTKLNLTDTFTSSYIGNAWSERESWLLYDASGPNWVNLYYLANGNTGNVRLVDANGKTVSIDAAWAGSKALSSLDITKLASNAQKLFHLMTTRPGIDEDNYLTLGDFTRDERTGNYTLDYLVFVPSDQAFNDTLTNTVEGDILGAPVESEVQTKFEISPGPLLVKGVDTYTPNEGSYQDSSSSTSSSKHYGYGMTLGEGETYDEVEYSVIFNPSYLKNIYDADGTFVQAKSSDWATLVGSIPALTIEDLIGGGYLIGGGAIRESGGSNPFNLGDTDAILSSVSIQVYQGSQPSAGQKYAYGYNSGYSALLKAEKEFLDYMEENGNILELNAAGETEKAAKLLQLYNAYNSAYSAWANASHYVGEVASGASVSLNGNKIHVEIPNGTLQLVRYQYIPTAARQQTGGTSISNLTNLTGANMYIVIRYKVPLKTPITADSGTSFSADNGAVVYFGGDTDSSNDPVPPGYVNTTYSVGVTRPQTDVPELTLNKYATDSLTFRDETFAYTNEAVTTVGWRIAARLKNFQIGETVTLTDTLPEELSYVEGSLIAFVQSSTGVPAATLAYEERKMDPGAYELAVNGLELTITVTYTEALAAQLDKLGSSANNRYLQFYFQTDASAAYQGAVGTKTLSNTVTSTVNGQPVKGTASKTVTVPELLTKAATDASGEVSTEPVYENGLIYGYYKLTVNPKGVDLSDGETVDVVDTMTPQMVLDTDSVKAVNSATGEALEITVSGENGVWTFAIPDDVPVTVTYRVKFNVRPADDPNWMRTEITGNTAKITGLSSGGEPEDAADYAKARYAMSIYAYETDSDVTVFKYWDDNGTQKPLNGSRFELVSVFDNQGHTYGGESGITDTIAARYPNGAEIKDPGDATAEDGTRTFENIPLDRIFRLTEIEAPDGYALDDTPYYFVIRGADYDALVEKLPVRDGDVEITEAMLTVFDPDDASRVLEVENEKREIRIRKVDDAGAALSGAQLQILDGDGKVVEEWTSGSEAHLVEAVLPVGNYTLHEVKAPEGYAVADDQAFTVEASTKEIELTMTDGELTEVTVLKVWEGDTENSRPESLDVQLYRNREALGETVTLNGKGGWTYTWTGLRKYDDTGTAYTYTVGEPSVPAGYTADMSAEDGGAKITITNTFKAASAEIQVQKTLEGRDWESGDSFSFTLAAVDGAPLPANTSVTVSSAEAASFGSISYDAVGTYAYTVTEIKGTLDGVSYDTTAHAVTVTVTTDETNALVAGVDYAGAKSLSVTNTFSPVTVELEVTKRLTGREWTDEDSFSFTLAAVQDEPMPEEGSETVTATKAEKSGSFGPITFEKAGTYSYTIMEVNGELGGVTYDQKSYVVVVTVSRDEETNALSAEVSYDGSDSLTIENIYEATGFVILEAKKELTGRSLAEGEFSFTLLDSEGSELETVKNAADGSIVFTALEYSLEDIGDPIVYTVREEKGAQEGMTYEERLLTVTVTLSDNGDGTLNVVTSYEGLSDSTFVNTYESSGELALTASKKLIGHALEDGQFHFELLDSEGKALQTVTNDADGNIAFEALTYDRTLFETEDGYAGAVKLSYTVREVNDGYPGYTYDSTEYTVNVTLTDDGAGNILAEVERGDGEADYRFVNRYSATGEIVLGAEKSVRGAELKAEQFSFALRDIDGKVIETVQNDAEGKITFSTITVDETVFAEGETEAVLTFTVNEVVPWLRLGYTYDRSVYTATVTLTDNGDGTISAKTVWSVNGKTVDRARFVNSYSADGPKTGDGNNLLLWTTLTLVSFGMLALMGDFGLKRRYKGKHCK